MRSPGRPRDDGAAAVEFAILSLLLLTILFGILQYGYFFLQATAAEHAAREGARLASVGIADCTAWADEVAERGGTADVQDVRVSLPGGDTTTGWSRGDTLVVSITWEPARFGSLVPFVTGTRVEEAVTRVESVGTLVGGCL